MRFVKALTRSMHICAKGLWGSDKPSLALRTPATALLKVVTRFEDGSPASPVGELIDAIATEVSAATSDQSHSGGAPDTNVPAKVGQVEERAWELFTG